MESSKLTIRPSKNSSGQTPKRHSARIEKPRSNHQSPRGLERRRTLTAVKQHASLDDHYRKMFGLEDEEEKEYGHQYYTNTRPLSWHPSSSRWAVDDFTTGSIHLQNQGSRAPMDNHGTSALYPQATAAQQDDESVAVYASQVDAAWSSYMHGHAVPPATNQLHVAFPYLPPASIYQPEDQQTQSLLIEHDMQQEQDWEKGSGGRFVREKSTELIGLGLYDPPGSTPPPMHTSGKGLKLEETWQPPEDMEDADAEEESEDEEEEPPRPQDTKHLQSTLPLVSMAGQSFFFEEYEGLKNEWWYHQLKNPSPQVSSLGYGWI